jgi:hypothetical protein
LNQHDFENFLAPKPIMGDDRRRKLKYLLIGGALECFLLWASWNAAFLAIASWHAHANGWTQTYGTVTSRSTTKYKEIFVTYLTQSGEKRSLAQPIDSAGGPNQQYWSGYRPGDTVPVYVSQSMPSFARLDKTLGTEFLDVVSYGFSALFFLALALLVGWLAKVSYALPSSNR